MKKSYIILDYALIIISFLALSFTFNIQNIVRDIDFKVFLLILSFYMFIFFIKSLISLYTDKGLIKSK